jgi:hypothetical protein
MIYKHKKTGQFAVMITLDPQTASAFVGQSDHTCLVQLAGSMMVNLYTKREFDMEYTPLSTNDTQATSALTSSVTNYQNRKALVEEASKAFEATIDKHLSAMLGRIKSLEEKVTPYWQSQQARKSRQDIINQIAQVRRDLERQIEPLKQSHAARHTLGEKVGELYRIHNENVMATTQFAKDVGANLRRILYELSMPDTLIIGGEEVEMTGSQMMSAPQESTNAPLLKSNFWDDIEEDDFEDDEEVDYEEADYERLYAVHAIGNNTQREYTYYTYADDSGQAKALVEDWLDRNGYYSTVIGTQTISFLPTGSSLIQ